MKRRDSNGIDLSGLFLESLLQLVEFLLEPCLAGNQKPRENEDDDECQRVRYEKISHGRG
jgi:hypothetical protein